MPISNRIQNRKKEMTTNIYETNGYSSNPIGSVDFRPTPSFVFKIEKPKESYEDLCKMAQKNFGKQINYKIEQDIVICGNIVTSISPTIFNTLNEKEKDLVANFPNSDIATAILQKRS